MAKKSETAGPADPADPNVAPEAAGPSREEAARAVGIEPERVFAWKDHGDHLNVVTVDGRKLTVRAGGGR